VLSTSGRRVSLGLASQRQLGLGQTNTVQAESKILSRQPPRVKTPDRHPRIQDVGLRGADDPTVLERAADENRVLLTHDVATMAVFAYKRLAAGLRMPGVFEISAGLPLTRAIDEIVLLAECSLDGEWEGRVRYLPLR